MQDKWCARRVRLASTVRSKALSTVFRVLSALSPTALGACNVSPVLLAPTSQSPVRGVASFRGKLWQDCALPSCVRGYRPFIVENCIPFVFSLGQSSCLECGVGTATDQVAQEFCAPCAAGSFTDRNGSMACSSCLPGTAQPQSGQTSCVACAPGSATPDTGKTACSLCNPGEKQPLYGNISCVPCERGTFTTQNGTRYAVCVLFSFCLPPQQSLCFLFCVPSSLGV
jgi:hypothetical protein